MGLKLSHGIRRLMLRTHETQNEEYMVRPERFELPAY